MRRRDFIGGLSSLAAAWPQSARAQRRIARVGILLIGSSAAAKDLIIAAELARLGYVEGRNIAYETRGAHGNFGRLSALARELVSTRPDVLICASGVVANTLAAATRDIPIVATTTVDPIALGLTASISRPSRNITGFTSSNLSLTAKRLELLSELIPGLKRVGYLGEPSGSPFEILELEQQVRNAGKALGITVVYVPVASADRVSESFNVLDREKVQAVVVGISPTTVQVSGHIIDECLVRDLPAIHPWSFEVNAGALMSYGPVSFENNAGAAKYVDRLLNGSKVAELPFQEPTEIKFAINLRTARAIKLRVPPTLLARADEVID
jgi:putative ABC transport system substrate-binding protein